MTQSEKSELILGWRTNQMLDPVYWVEGNATAGLQALEDLVRVPAESIANHTAIIAQSGSGKSFLLGRLIEEIIVRSKARCVILDPNADFRRVHEVEDASLWTAAAYDRNRRRGKLPHESTQDDFLKLWHKIPIRIRTGERDNPLTDPYERLQVSWPSLSMDVLAEDIDPMLRSDLYHCHKFVQELAELHQLKDSGPIKTRELIEEAEQLLRHARLSGADFRITLETKYKADEILRLPEKQDTPPYITMFTSASSSLIRDRQFLDFIRSAARSMLSSLIESLVRAPNYVSPAVEHFYFSKARSYETAGVITSDLPSRQHQRREVEKRLEVIDLPSLKDQATRLLAINAIITSEWNQARAQWASTLRRPANRDNRVPTFIVIDEAHNLIPAEPRTKAEAAVRELFRTIVAEGRKYGLFLLLVSQRPDKLDPLVLSECENKAIMRLGSGSVLNITRNMLGLDDVNPKILEKCLEFDLGRALLVGRWSASGPQFVYCAARRTIEGGRNLREEHWAVSADSIHRVKKMPTRRPETPRKKGRKLSKGK
jgi:hypothetical protein